jgi:hypothetical protein
MKGAYLKLLRARELADLIESEVSRVANSESPPRLAYERLNEGRKHQWRIQGLNALNQLFPLWVGDCLHNYRTVLDHVAWTLTELTGNPPGLNTKFPLTPEDVPKKALTVDPSVSLDNSVNDVVRLAREMMYGEGEQAPLAHLSRLDNADKHRVLLLSSARVSYTTLELDSSSARPTFMGNGGPLRDGSVALVVYTAMPEHLDVPATLNLEVRFDEAHERVPGQTTFETQAPYPQPVLPLIEAIDGQIAHHLLPKTAELVARDHTHDEQGNRNFWKVPRCFFEGDNSSS